MRAGTQVSPAVFAKLGTPLNLREPPESSSRVPSVCLQSIVRAKQYVSRLFLGASLIYLSKSCWCMPRKSVQF